MVQDENIFVFIPNLIGYARIVLALVSFYFMPTNCGLTIVCYVTSALLDAFDGYAARAFNQSTLFGAMLDQLTDRCATMCLCVVLSYFYPSYMFLFQLSMTVDIASHWIYLHTSILQGKSSHKYIDVSENAVMRLYYTSRPVLFCMCAGNEAFFASLYMLHFYSGPLIAGIPLFRLLVYASAPIALAKTAISILHCYIAARNLGIIDVNNRLKAAK